MSEHLKKYAAFHEYFVGLAGSPALVDAHRRVNAAAMILSVTGKRAVAQHAYADAAASAYRHHMKLLAAYEAGDLEAAVTDDPPPHRRLARVHPPATWSPWAARSRY